MTAQLVSLIFVGLAGVILAVHGLGQRPAQPVVVRKSERQRR
jgi:hypothetical protein